MENLFLMASHCLAESNIDNKSQLSILVAEKILSGKAGFEPDVIRPQDIIVGRPDKPELVAPKDLPRRSLKNIQGKAAMIHSFAHIEFNAINLAWDLICRFQHMPEEFYMDWARIAAEEAKHFNLLRKNLIDIGFDYGDFPAHNGLWKIATDTQHDLLLRLAVVPRIMEARGLDVSPDLIKRFQEISDHKTVSILNIILDEEIGHVAIGTKWYRYVCNENGKDPEITFQKIIKEYLPSNNNKKLNKNARLLAGFSHSELEYIASI